MSCRIHFNSNTNIVTVYMVVRNDEVDERMKRTNKYWSREESCCYLDRCIICKTTQSINQSINLSNFYSANIPGEDVSYARQHNSEAGSARNAARRTLERTTRKQMAGWCSRMDRHASRAIDGSDSDQAAMEWNDFKNPSQHQLICGPRWWWSMVTLFHLLHAGKVLVRTSGVAWA